MNLPDWRTFDFEPGILAEPIADGSRLVLWVPGDRDASFQYWERVGSVVRGEVVAEQGLCATAATSVPVRQRVRGGLGQLFKNLRPPKSGRGFLLPDGSSSEQCGERRADLILVWSPDADPQFDEARIQSAWPRGKGCRRLGHNLFLVSGVEPQSARPVQQAEREPAPASENPRIHAESLLAAARRAGDRQQEATSLADLGVILMGEGNPAGSIASLESALVIARELGDAERGRDIIGNLGLAKMAVGQPEQARQMFEQGLTYARANRDHLTEKTALERLGLVHWHLREFSRALAFFEQALALARLVGDRLQVGNLLWYQGIQHAELGQRDLAIARAEESIALFKAMGRPQAAWYGSHLQKYRMGLYDEQPAASGAGVSFLRRSRSWEGRSWRA